MQYQQQQSQQVQRRANITTVLDLCDRDEQDDILFPIDTQESLFYRKGQQYINHVSSLTEHTQRGPAEFGQKFSYDIGRKHGDFLAGAFLQIKLGHWLSPTALEALMADPLGCPWRYANCLGNIIIAKAELEINGIIIETIDSDYIYIKTLLESDSNKFGLLYDGYGKDPQVDAPYPTENGTLICPLPFHFMTSEKKSLLALIATAENSIKINIQLRPFTECITLINAYRKRCTSTPLMSEFNIGLVNYKTPIKEPRFEDVRLLLQGVYYDNMLRDAYLRKPFEYIIRQPSIFGFTEPMKYVTNKTAIDKVTIQLPLEINNPIEEILWIFRRKSAAINNEWNNYSGYTVLQKKQIEDANMHPKFTLPSPITNANLQINGVEVINADGEYFRNRISSVHPGGYNAYSQYIYGYNFAKEPGKHQPSGSFNASRTTSVRLTLEVSIPQVIEEASDMEWDDETLRGWEIKVFVIGLNWLRFENGISNLLFKD